ncbi:unnamed protein product [Ectocarpus sp. CCAP 1310/34]|nr:unnamed protein product [Ectocarpus sp. CCAP 1310/34]
MRKLPDVVLSSLPAPAHPALAFPGTPERRRKWRGGSLLRTRGSERRVGDERRRLKGKGTVRKSVVRPLALGPTTCSTVREEVLTAVPAKRAGRTVALQRYLESFFREECRLPAVITTG